MQEPSNNSKKLARYDSSQVMLVHKECLMRSTKAQQLVRPEDDGWCAQLSAAI
jgi:hypothetical protein